MQTDTNINTKYGDSFLKAQGDIFKLMLAEESMDNLYIFVNGYILYSQFYFRMKHGFSQNLAGFNLAYLFSIVFPFCISPYCDLFLICRSMNPTFHWLYQGNIFRLLVLSNQEMCFIHKQIKQHPELTFAMMEWPYVSFD